MPISAGSVFLEVVPDLKSFSAPLQEQIRASMSQAKKTVLSSSKAMFAGAGAAIAAGIAVNVIGNAVKKYQEAAGEVRKLKVQLGLTAEEASRLRSIGNQLGLSTDQLSKGFGIFAKNLANANPKLEKYGIEAIRAKDGSVDFEATLGEVSDAFLNLPAGIDRTAFAMNVFGRSGKDLIPLLSQGREGLAKFAEEAEKAGVILSEDDVRGARALAIAQRQLKEAQEGLSLSIARAFIPALTKVAHLLTAGVELFQKIPGPVKSATLAFVALGGGLVALGLALRVVRAGLGGFRTQIAAEAATAEGAAVANGAFATSLGAMRTVMFGPLGLIAGLGAFAANTLQSAANARVNAEAVKEMNKALADGKVTLEQLNQAIDDEDIPQWAKDQLHANVAKTDVAMAEAAESADDLGAAIDDAGDKGKAAVEKMRTAAQGIRDQVKGATTAFQDLADGGKITARELVRAFDKQLEDARNFSRNIRTLVSRGLSPEAIQDFIDQMGTDAPAALETLANASGDDLQRVQDDMLRTKNSAREAARFATGLKTKLDEIPRNVDTHFRAIGADVWAAEVAKVLGSLSQIPRGVVTTFASPTFRRIAQGGVIRGQEGFITRGPTFMVGEGRNATFAGRGAEAVIPFDSRGIDILAQAIARASDLSGGHSRAAPPLVMHNTFNEAKTPREQLQELAWLSRSRGW